MAAAFTWSDGEDLALAIFLICVGLMLGWALLALSGVFVRLSALIRGTQDEILPVINKVGGSIDRVNSQLDKLDQATDSALDAVEAIDHTVRTVSVAVRRPVEAAAGVSSGVSHGFATLRARRDWRAALKSAREASARRKADIERELQHEDG